jgi:hypothetical protein
MCSSVQTENTTAVLFLSRFTCDFSSSWLVLCTSWAVLRAASSLVFLPHQSVPRSSLQPRSFWVRVFATQHRAWLIQQQELFRFFLSTPGSIASRPLSLSSLISCSSPARAEHYPDSFLPWFVHSCLACALHFLVRFSFSRAENGGQSSLVCTQLAFFGSVAGVASSTLIFSAFVLPNFVAIVEPVSFLSYRIKKLKVFLC